MNQILRTIIGNKALAIVFAGFILTIGTFIGNILLTRDITQNLRGNVAKVESIYSDLGTILQIENDLSIAENALKNYLISRQEIYRRSHLRALGRMDKAMVDFSKKMEEFQISKEQVGQLRRLVNERKLLFSKTILQQPAPDGTAREFTKVLLGQGADKTFEIREALHKLENELRVSLEINRKYIARSISYGSYTNYLAICIALVVAFFSTVSITQDFLRQKEIERILRQLNDEKARLFSILGHDLRSPLSGINAIIYILKNHRAAISEQELKDYLDQLDQSAVNYGKLLEDVLTWSRLQLNKIQIHPEPHPIKLLGQEVIDLYSDQLNSKRISIHNMISSDLVLMVDKAMIQTVLRNLISNAIKFSFAGGEIRLSHREDKDYYFIEVQDYGVGMGPAIVKTLFTNNTISMSGTENEAGTGLGLSICKEFLSKQEGDILVHSVENKGSVFSIQIPKEEMLRKIKKNKSKLPGAENNAGQDGIV